jgi:hypothetical protein
VQEGAAGSSLPETTVSRAVAEDAVAVGESRSRSKSRSRFWARSRSLLESFAALWFSGEAIACLLAVTVLRAWNKEDNMERTWIKTVTLS